MFPKFKKLTSHEVASLSFPNGASSAPIATKKVPGVLPYLLIDTDLPTAINGLQDQGSSHSLDVLHLDHLGSLFAQPGGLVLIPLYLWT